MWTGRLLLLLTVFGHSLCEKCCMENTAGMVMELPEELCEMDKHIIVNGIKSHPSSSVAGQMFKMLDSDEDGELTVEELDSFVVEPCADEQESEESGGSEEEESSEEEKEEENEEEEEEEEEEENEGKEVEEAIKIVNT